jgi:IclR family KDG regulon transcriptional repressor
MVRREKSNYVIQSVSHALDVLEQFCADTDEIGVTELSRRLKLHKNNVFRLLATLESRGYIEQNKVSENYRLGLRCLQLGKTYVHQIGFLEQANAVLKGLVTEVQESAFAALRKGKEIVPLDFVEPQRAVRVMPFLGLTLPLHCTAAGKIHLAFEAEGEFREGLPEALPKYTDHTIVDRGSLIKQIKEVSEKGYAVDQGEFIEDVCCAAVPIRDYARNLVGSLSVAGPVYRLTPERMDREIIPRVMQGGKELSRRLGFPG